jgi:hypothetical protein
MKRRAFIVGLALAATACGGSQSTLHTLGIPKGKGPIQFEVENRTDSAVNNLYMVETAKVKAAGRKALESGTPEQAALWRDDLLTQSALEPKGKMALAVPGPGRYDVRAIAKDGREQHVAGLKLAAGGRYVLELNDGGWRPPP